MTHRLKTLSLMSLIDTAELWPLRRLLMLFFIFFSLQAEMHGMLTFVLIPSLQTKPPPHKETVVSHPAAPFGKGVDTRRVTMRCALA